MGSLFAVLLCDKDNIEVTLQKCFFTYSLLG